MSQLKKVLITVPDALLKEVDSLAGKEAISRSELVLKAVKLYLSEKENMRKADRMKKGYQEMAEINAELAELCLNAEAEVLSAYEEKLAECE